MWPVLLAVAVAPGLFWLWYFLRRDRLKPEPQHLVRKVFYLGAASGGVAALVEYLIIGGSVMEAVSEGPGRLVTMALLIGIIEEGAKFVAVYLGAYRHHEFNEVFDGMIYAVAASMGFATLENIAYVMAGGLTVGAVRAVLSVPGHAFFGTVMGYSMGMAKLAGPRELWWLLRGLLFAIIAHALFDAVLFTQTALALLVVPLLILLWRYAVVHAHRAQALDDHRWSGAPPAG
ncbi:MAG: PrsW family glutamic-type intramembrane protease [Armatimonadota bacterium]|nr:PrsW family glutamic-type intramembrane protease [Armatimonadota bacterium]